MAEPPAAAVVELHLSPAVADAIRAHALAEAPNEACGLLSGPPGEGRATWFHPARNALASPYRYDVHGEDLVRIVHEVERAGGELVAIFHSHVGSAAVPSPTDVREARYPVAHVVASLAEPAVTFRAWSIVGGTSVEVPLLVG